MTTAVVLGAGVGVATLGVGVAARGVGVATVMGVGVTALVAAPPLRLGLTTDDVAVATLPVGEEVIPQAARRAEAAPSMTSRESPR
jgi:hypothetical protein